MDNNFGKWKGIFSPTVQNEQTGQSGPSLKMVVIILVRLNPNGPFHFDFKPKFPEFWVEWKMPKLSPVAIFLRPWYGFV